MPPESTDQALLLDIIAAGERVQRFCEGLDSATFQKDEKTISAVERQIAIIGEASGKLSNEFRQDTSHIPWRDIISMRHILVHHYGKVLSAPLWKTATEDVPLLLDELRPYVSP